MKSRHMMKMEIKKCIADLHKTGDGRIEQTCIVALQGLIPLLETYEREFEAADIGEGVDAKTVAEKLANDMKEGKLKELEAEIQFARERVSRMR